MSPNGTPIYIGTIRRSIATYIGTMIIIGISTTTAGTMLSRVHMSTSMSRLFTRIPTTRTCIIGTDTDACSLM